MISCTELDKIWERWITERMSTMPREFHAYYSSRKYERINRLVGNGKEFEDWLYTFGGIVHQINKARVLKFNSEKQELWFRLTC
jgi:hypothetical protein